MATALIAVIGALGPQILKLVERPRSHLTGSLVYIDRDNAVLLASNGGSRLGAVMRAQLELYMPRPATPDVKMRVALDLIPSDRNATFVEPNNSAKILGSWGEGLIVLEKEGETRDSFPSLPLRGEIRRHLEDPEKSCNLRLQIANSDSTTETVISTFRCGAFGEALATH